MDDVNRQLILLLEEDPRVSLQELAKRLGISRQSVHRRMRALMKAGASEGVRAEISFRYLHGVLVRIWGISRTTSVNDTLDRLGESEFTMSVVVAGANQLIVFGCLRNMSELNSYAEFVRRAAQIPEPTIGIVCVDDGINPEWVYGGKQKQSYKALSPLDMSIIASLRKNVRIPTDEVADSIGVSTKTVKRHLERMRAEGSLYYDCLADIPPGEDMLTVLHLNLRSGTDKVKVGRRLLSKYPLRITLIKSFSNIPDFLSGLLRTERVKEMRKILKEIREDEDILIVAPNFIFLERDYETTWYHKLLGSVARSP